MNDAYYDVIERRYNFIVPKEYRLLACKGLFLLDGPAHCSQFYEPGSYLWLNDMEWYSAQQIAGFEFEPDQLSGFVPFAFTAAGDYWCWQPALTNEQGTRVLRCDHDDEMADVYAPNFHTALFRQALDFCRSSDEDTELDASAFLQRWAIDLAEVLPASWCGHLVHLANATRRADLAAAIERSEIAFPDKDSRVRWMQAIR